MKKSRSWPDIIGTPLLFLHAAIFGQLLLFFKMGWLDAYVRCFPQLPEPLLATTVVAPSAGMLPTHLRIVILYNSVLREDVQFGWLEVVLLLWRAGRSSVMRRIFAVFSKVTILACAPAWTLLDMFLCLRVAAVNEPGRWL